MREAIGRSIIWGLFATIAVILMAGCATQEERLMRTALKSQERMVKAAIKEKQVDRLVRSKNARLKQETNTREIQRLRQADYQADRSCVNQRWGRCEEHGEWWEFAGARINVSFCHDITGEITMAILVCPRGHYIEREIKGPKEKP